jgi:hypothetical protein
MDALRSPGVVAQSKRDAPHEPALWQNVIEFGIKRDSEATDTATAQAAVDIFASRGGVRHFSCLEFFAWVALSSRAM